MDTSTNVLTDRLINLYNNEICRVCVYKETDCIKTMVIEQKQRSISIKCEGYEHK